jgi:hypothetical protein
MKLAASRNAPLVICPELCLSGWRLALFSPIPRDKGPSLGDPQPIIVLHFLKIEITVTILRGRFTNKEHSCLSGLYLLRPWNLELQIAQMWTGEKTDYCPLVCRKEAR